MQDHIEVVQKIVEKELNEVPLKIERMTTGICNEVFSVTLTSKSVIVRMNADEYQIGSDEFIPFFQSKGIRVPEILALDYSKQFVPFVYQIQTKLEGKDIGQVIQNLSDGELQSIAEEIANIAKMLAPTPTNGKFGWIGSDKKRLFDSWIAFIEKMEDDICRRNTQTGIVGEVYIETFRKTFERYRSYFETVPSTFYYDDMSSKNVLIYEGKFSGLVDLDTMAYGDPLEGIGRIEASWYGTHYGTVYTEAIVRELALNEKQREIVTAYALLNRIYWLSEKGIQFNQNTSTKIDQVAVAEDKQIIDALMVSLAL